MSKKITESMLKGLVEEVLNEELLNEFKLSIPKNKKTRNDLNTGLGLDNQKFKDAAGETSYRDAYLKYKELASTGTDPSAINDDDFKQAWNSPETDEMNKFADSIADKSSKSDRSWANIGGTNNPKSTSNNPGTGTFKYGTILDDTGTLLSALTYRNKPRKGDIAKLLKKYANDPRTAADWPAILTQLATAFSGSEFGTTVKKQADKLGATPPPPSRTQVSTEINAIADFMIDNPTDITFDNLQMAQPFGSIDFSAADTDTKGVKKKDTMDKAAGAIKNQIKNARFDASIVNQMAVFDSDTVEGKINQLNDAAITLSNIEASKLRAMSAEDKLKLATKLNVLTYLTNISKVFDSSSAGFAFEKFVIAFFGGIGIGGVNGAIDAALAGKNGTVLPTSEKLLSGGYVKQSRGKSGEQGLRGALEEYGSVLYFVGLKVDGSSGGDLHKATSYQSIKLYVLKVNKDGTIDNLSTSGEFNKTSETFNVVSDDSEIISFAKVKGFTPLADLAMLKTANDSATAIANSIANDLSSDSFLGNLLNIYKRLENMKRNTQSYQTTGGGKTSKSAAGKTAKEYVDEVAKDYSGIKTEYKSVFETAEKDITGGTSLNESKKVTADLLKKLIQEKFKK